MSTFVRLHKQFRNELYANQRGSDMEKIIEYVQEQCWSTFDDSAFDEPTLYFPDNFRFGCRHRSISKYIELLNELEITNIWNKYSSLLGEQVELLNKCESKYVNRFLIIIF